MEQDQHAFSPTMSPNETEFDENEDIRMLVQNVTNDRLMLNFKFKYGPFSIEKKVVKPNNKIGFEKVDLLPLNGTSYKKLHSDLRLVCLVKNKIYGEFMNTLIRPLGDNEIGSWIRTLINVDVKYLTINSEEKKNEATAEFLNSTDLVTQAQPIPIFFPDKATADSAELDSSSTEANKVFSTDVPIMMNTDITADRVRCESFKELIFVMSSDAEHKNKFSRRCRCGIMVYISTKNGGNLNCSNNEIHNKCSHIPTIGCCPL